MTKSKIVLIIDDDADDRFLFSDAVKSINNSILCLAVNSGREGINLLKNEDYPLPDLIFLDLNMPCLNGKQCLSEIKKNARFSHIPVIIYSTTKRMEDISETKKLGAAYFLTKPVLFEDICKAIKMLLETKWEKMSYSSGKESSRL